MERIEGFVEEKVDTGKPKIKGFVINGKVFEGIWGKNKKPIGVVRGDEAYDNNQKYLGKVAYYKNPHT